MREISVGQVLDDRYEVLELIGEGGMGRVYRARQVKLDRVVALKVPSPAVLEDPDFVRRFEREAMTVARFHHDNIVMIHDVFVGDDLAYLSMEYVEGQPLDRVITRGFWTLTIGDLLSLIRQCCEGLEAAHGQGVIHRDIKPANIFVATKGQRVKIMDFGIARAGDATMITQTGQVMGTPHYMSPEQIMGKQVGPPSDIYAMSVLTFQLLTLSHLFEGPTTTLIYKHINEAPPSAHGRNTRLPESIDFILARGLAKNPHERYQRATELSSALEQVLGPRGEMPYHQLMSLDVQRLVELGIPPTPPATTEVGLDSAAIELATELVKPSTGAVTSPPTLPPTMATPPPTAARRPTSPLPSPTASPLAERPTTGAVRTAGMVMSGTAKVAVPTARVGGKALVAILALPFKVLRAMPPKAIAALAGIVVLGVGGVYVYRNFGDAFSRSRSSSAAPAQSVAPSGGAGEPAAPPSPAVDRPSETQGSNRLPQVNFNPQPRSLYSRTQLPGATIRLNGRDTDGEVTHYLISLDGQPAQQVRNDRGVGTWSIPTNLPAGEHTIQVVAVDDAGGMTRPPRQHTFTVVGDLEEENLDGATP